MPARPCARRHESLESLESLDSLESLESLESLDVEGKGRSTQMLRGKGEAPTAAVALLLSTLEGNLLVSLLGWTSFGGYIGAAMVHHESIPFRLRFRNRFVLSLEQKYDQTTTDRTRHDMLCIQRQIALRCPCVHIPLRDSRRRQGSGAARREPASDATLDFPQGRPLFPCRAAQSLAFFRATPFTHSPDSGHAFSPESGDVVLFMRGGKVQPLCGSCLRGD